MSVRVEMGKYLAIRKEITKAGNLHVKVGVLSDEGHDGELSILELAAIHEFGSPAANIPQRSFIGSTMNEKEREIAELCAKLVGKIYEGKMTAEKALEILGQFLAAEIKKKVTTGDHIPPPLAPATVAAKGSDRPLVDTGQMINSVTHKVHTGTED
jgi:hypothetical protein